MRARPVSGASPNARNRILNMSGCRVWLPRKASLIAMAVLSSLVTPRWGHTQPDSSADVIAVCPPALQSSLSGWLARRSGEGLVVKVVAPHTSATETRQRIAAAAVVGKTRYVVLIGDPQLDASGNPADLNVYLPTIYQPANATAAYQATSHLPGDYLYGDFNDDSVVDAAVGRLPVRTSQQALELFQRIADYEDSRDFGRWRSRVDLVAGLGGFGPLIDGAIETVASGMITGSLPGSVRTRVTHAGPESLFCPGPLCFTDTVLANYSDGARFWVYAGHGHVSQLDRVPATRSGRPVLAVEDVTHLRRPANSAPIALLLACYTGAYDASEDCLAKEMLLAQGGPIAVLAGSRVTMPYGNAAAAMGLIHSVYHRHPERLGDAWLQTLAEMATPSATDPALQSRRGLIDGLATMLGGGRIDEERREHMQLYNWMGDPTLRLAHPQEIQINPLPQFVAGQAVTISGSVPTAGAMTIELHRRLGTVPSSKAKLAGLQQTPDDLIARYRLANDTSVATRQVLLSSPGDWSTDLQVPPGTSGPMRLVIDVEGPEGFASGTQSVWIRPAGSQ